MFGKVADVIAHYYAVKLDTPIDPAQLLMLAPPFLLLQHCHFDTLLCATRTRRGDQI